MAAVVGDCGKQTVSLHKSPIRIAIEMSTLYNTISTRGADYAHHSTTCPSGFLALAAFLHFIVFLKSAGMMVDKSWISHNFDI